ncbi:MAG: hypothetical protein KY455_12860 [Euryarchaeota archaeon]|nr:hypothetical protein [Euryarchaeota archaeon]
MDIDGRRRAAPGPAAPGPPEHDLDVQARVRRPSTLFPTAAGGYTVRDQWLDLLDVPQRPRPLFNLRRLLSLIKRTTDFFGHRRVWFNELLVRLNPYPHPFRRVRIESADGTVISAWLGLQPVPRPGVVLVPGMFSSKDDTAIKGRAIRMWRRWNYNVLAIELRGFGQSSGSPNTAGWKESEDVLAAARYLRSFNNVTRIGVIGESMGATAALIAAANEGIEEGQALGETPREAGEGDAPAVDGPRAAHPHPRRAIDSVLAFSPFTYPDRAVAHINRMPQRRDPFYRVQRLFIRLLSLHTQGRYRDFEEYMKGSAEQYGVSLDELYARSSVLDRVGHIKAHTLVVHAVDDPTVPVAHAEALNARTRDMDHVVIWMLNWGDHVEFDILDRRWYWRVVSRFMGQWVGR